MWRGVALLILGIESSCDETAVAVVEDNREVRGEQVASQTDLHAAYGGVVPEVASRGHIEAIGPLVRQVLQRAHCPASQLDAVAVTTAPGLIGALLVGLCFAESFAYALGIPALPVNHLEGHIAAVFLEHPNVTFPAIALVVSGGHTSLYHLTGWGENRLIGKTLDDAAGEAFDKGARMLGLGYPGGPIIDRMAEEGDPERVRFPRPRCADIASFSFSGLKTALKLKVAEQKETAHDLAAGFRAAIVDCLVTQTVAVALREKVKSILVVGGVSANRLLRRRMDEEGVRLGLAVHIPSPRYCTDNAVMIALAAGLQIDRPIRGNSIAR